MVRHHKEKRRFSGRVPEHLGQGACGVPRVCRSPLPTQSGGAFAEDGTLSLRGFIKRYVFGRVYDVLTRSSEIFQALSEEDEIGDPTG